MTRGERDSLLLPLPRADPLTAYWTVRRTLGSATAASISQIAVPWDGAGYKEREAPHALRPFQQKFSHLFRFSELVDLEWCGVRAVAAVYVSARLFGNQWAKYAPQLGCAQWIENVNRFVESSVGQKPVDMLELIELSRIFRTMVRVKRSLYRDMLIERASALSDGMQLARDVFCVGENDRSEQFRVALFTLVLAHANVERVPLRTRMKVARLMGRYSFASATQCADSERTLTRLDDKNRDGDWVVRALQSLLPRVSKSR